MEHWSGTMLIIYATKSTIPYYHLQSNSKLVMMRFIVITFDYWRPQDVLVRIDNQNSLMMFMSLEQLQIVCCVASCQNLNIVSCTNQQSTSRQEQLANQENQPNQQNRRCFNLCTQKTFFSSSSSCGNLDFG